MATASKYIKKCPTQVVCGDVSITSLNTSAILGNVYKEHHASEYVLDVQVDQAYTVAPTVINVDEAFKKIVLEINGSEYYNASSRAINALNSFVEQPGGVTTYNDGFASHVKFTIELHIEAEGMQEDFLTLVNKPDLLSLNITTGDNSIFGNGTMTGNPLFTIRCRAKDYGIKQTYDDAGVWKMRVQERQAENSTAIGAPRTLTLDGHCSMRHIALIAGTVVGSVFTPNDDVITDISYKIGGETTTTTWRALKSMLKRQTGIDKTGVSGVIFGDTVSELGVVGAENFLLNYTQSNPAGATVSLRVATEALKLI